MMMGRVFVFCLHVEQILCAWYLAASGLDVSHNALVVSQVYYQCLAVQQRRSFLLLGLLKLNAKSHSSV